MTALTPFSKNIPQGKFLLMSFIAGVLAMGGWLLYVAGLMAVRELPLFPAFFTPAVLLMSAVIYGAKKSHNHSLIFATWLLGSSFLGILLISTFPYVGLLRLRPAESDPDSQIGFAVFVVFYLVALLAAYQSALDTKRPMTTTWVFILIFGFFSGIAVMGAMFVPFYYIGLMFALVRWLVRWYLTDMSKKALKIRFMCSMVAILAIESAIFYQTYQLTQESNAVSQQVLDYKRTHGDYPLTAQIGKFSYTGVNYIYDPNSEQKTPYLGYRSLFMPFCEYDFDFDKQRWKDYCTD